MGADYGKALQDPDHYRAMLQLLDDNPPASLFIRWHDERVGADWHPFLFHVIGEEPALDSNLRIATQRLADQIEAGDIEEGTIGRSGRTWMRGLLVRVSDPDGEPSDALVAVVDRVLDPLDDYPLLDEDDYAETRHQYLSEALAVDVGQDAADWLLYNLPDLDPYGVVDLWGDYLDVREVLDVVEAAMVGGLDAVDTLTPDIAGGWSWYVRQQADRYPSLAAFVGVDPAPATIE